MNSSTTTDSLSYFSERLHRRRSSLPRLRLGPPRRITRRICVRMAPGATEVIPGVDDSVIVRCAHGSLWITHDGDPKDIILGAQQSYQADREDVMRMHALAPCVLEIQFEDDDEPVVT